MNQAINLIDEMIKEHRGGNPIEYSDDYIKALKEAKKRISSLPSDTQWIDTLQRYHQDEGCEVCKDKLGDYVLYDDLVELLRS